MLVLRNLLLTPELLPDSCLLSSILISFFFAWQLPSSSSCLPSFEPFLRTFGPFGGIDDNLSLLSVCGSPRSILFPASYFTNNSDFPFQVCTAPPLAPAPAPPCPRWWWTRPCRWSTLSSSALLISGSFSSLSILASLTLFLAPPSSCQSAPPPPSPLSASRRCWWWWRCPRLWPPPLSPGERPVSTFSPPSPLFFT